MKTFRMIGMALVAVMLSFTMSSCDNDDDEGHSNHSESLHCC